MDVGSASSFLGRGTCRKRILPDVPLTVQGTWDVIIVYSIEEAINQIPDREKNFRSSRTYTC